MYSTRIDCCPTTLHFASFFYGDFVLRHNQPSAPVVCACVIVLTRRPCACACEFVVARNLVLPLYVPLVSIERLIKPLLFRYGLGMNDRGSLNRPVCWQRRLCFYPSVIGIIFALHMHTHTHTHSEHRQYYLAVPLKHKHTQTLRATHTTMMRAALALGQSPKGCADCWDSGNRLLVVDARLRSRASGRLPGKRVQRV